MSPEEAIEEVFPRLKVRPIRSNPPKKSLLYKMFTGKDLFKVIEIRKKNIVSEVMKFKIEGDNKYYGNIVLKFTEDDLKDENLDICKLIENCPQLYNKKIIETSDVLFIITDRILPNDTIKKNFILYEKLHIENINDRFELKFVIFYDYYNQNSGHYIAYSKFRGEWYEFNDISLDYSFKTNPPLNGNKIENFYPVSFYYNLGFSYFFFFFQKFFLSSSAISKYFFYFSLNSLHFSL